ncbi:hypothetical protein Aeqsu_0168 [Aequorivita sublithincola DSM 14238]|uniref:Uncharacterized protein n=1 Tax=Aequorivita sublithincola (strain DSM 14238 / LMG 21431 / ACAM 643 / 9-3) TaxID=746697 RepID=I3YRS8_AEQSU|nr:hypothetical protein [Aequorivita sublithincola]AFL79696.1 hypothetical protein Aeqsu_0168 [Aequorivita sublithincola DSM 14238]
MKKLLFLLAFAFTFSAFSQTKILPKDIQIKTAILAAPEMYKVGVTVLGYNPEGKLVTLKEGTNRMVCLADDPNNEGISVACYGAELEPFMARGRQLAAEGKTNEEKREARKNEIDNGTLIMPTEPSMTYIVAGEEKDYNPETGELQNSKIRYVIYKPYMTGESTGLPTKPQDPGMPWLMDAGTHRSHIMITPAN